MKSKKETVDQKEIIEKVPVAKKPVLTEEQKRIAHIRAQEMVMEEERLAEAKRIRAKAEAIRARQEEEREIERLRSIIAMEDKERKDEAQRLKDNKIVRGIFRHHEAPGGKLNFPFRKWKKDGVKFYSLQDEAICEIPIMVAQHLKNNVSYPILGHMKDADGRELVSTRKVHNRVSFHPLNFSEEESVDKIDRSSAIGPSQLISTSGDAFAGKQIDF